MKHIKNIIALILLANFSFAQGNFINDSLDIYIKREMKRWELPGMAIAIIKDGKVIFMKGYGVSDLTKKTPVTENTTFQIASNSKAFTGTSLALLESFGKISLNDKVKKYLPYFRMNEDWKTEEVSILDVLSHRIGFGTFQSDLLNWDCTKTRKELIENMINVTPKYGFREHYGYCNMGFVTAGEIIPAVCDTSWDDFLKYHYFIPLEMKSTGTTYSTFVNSPNASKAYSMWNNKITEIPVANVDGLGPAGSITSCVNDMSKWVMMQLANGKYNGKQVVPMSVIKRTRESNTIVGQSEGKGNNFNAYGLGWFLKDEFGKKVVEHDGGANGFLSKTVLIPEENFGFVILTNSDAQYLFEAIGKQLVMDICKQPYYNYSTYYYQGYIGNHEAEQNEIKKMRATAAAFKPAADAYKKLEGVYHNGVYGKIAIQAKDKFAEVSFEFHPQYKGKLTFLTPNTLMIEYNQAILGIKEISFQEKDKKGRKTIEIRVNDFVDMDPYLFMQVNEVYQSFGTATNTMPTVVPKKK